MLVVTDEHGVAVEGVDNVEQAHWLGMGSHALLSGAGASSYCIVEATGELELVWQSLQSALPNVDLYLPMTQASHAPPLGPVYPALQTQSVTDVLASGEEEYDGQFWHEASLSALYWLAMHTLHDPPSGPE